MMMRFLFLAHCLIFCTIGHASAEGLCKVMFKGEEHWCLQPIQGKPIGSSCQCRMLTGELVGGRIESSSSVESSWNKKHLSQTGSANRCNHNTDFNHIVVRWNQDCEGGLFRVHKFDGEDDQSWSGVTGYVHNVVSRDNTICGQVGNMGLAYMPWPLPEEGATATTTGWIPFLCKTKTKRVRDGYDIVAPLNDKFVANGWTYKGPENRLCKAELSCDGSIPKCEAGGVNSGKLIQDRRSHNGCVAQQCEGDSLQFALNTYKCDK